MSRAVQGKAGIECIRDGKGAEGSAQHRSEAKPWTARPERSEGNALKHLKILPYFCRIILGR